jgi:outer membrane lipoprotein-sorting protein
LPAFLGQGAIAADETFRIWVDQETQLPIRVSIQLHRSFGQQKSTSEMEMTDFDWNPEMDPTMFAMDTPEGFELKDAADFNGGDFNGGK